LIGIACFTIFCYSLFIATFWDSEESSQALVLVAGGIISYFCVNPYLLSLVDWRNAQNEEAYVYFGCRQYQQVFLCRSVPRSLLILITVRL
jgi:hypothetical protein